ncbi:response regulator [Dyadobacter sp. CY347]|uniref:response regulator n=1 Tax=Dyadobacter sp. CY347 TaxID=2909336 RepID=UPI0038D51233
MLRVVGLCSDAFKAGEKIQEQPVDLLLMDINMLVRSGIKLLKTLKNTPLVVSLQLYKEFATDALTWLPAIIC